MQATVTASDSAKMGMFGSFGIKMSERLNGIQVFSGEGWGGKYLIYALIIGVIIAVGVLIADNFYPFLPANPMGGPSAAARAGKVFWKSTEDNAENLIVPVKDSPTKRPANYSVSVQIVITDSRTPGIGRFRHVLHRGSNPCGITATTPGPSGHAGIQPSDLPDTEPTYKQNGLPALMNPGLFLDRYKNDLHVFVHTKGQEDHSEALWLESLTIEDLPLNTPLTIGVICNGKILEVYMNCRLYSTLMLKGTPYMPKNDNQWFGRYCANPMFGSVQNLTLWADSLSLNDYVQMCTNPKFDTSKAPKPCAGSGGDSCPDTSLFGSLDALVQGNASDSQKKAVVASAATALL